jgi:hypothetical protein
VNDVLEFSNFTGLRESMELRTVTRAHVIAWRKELESRSLAPSSIRRKLIESAKKAETRSRRIEWGCSSLKDGKRRPCCWPGCAHR